MKRKIMNLHLDFVRHGQFEEGRKILRLLRNHKVWLNGFDDVTFNVELALRDIHCNFWYGRNFQQYAYFKEGNRP